MRITSLYINNFKSIDSVSLKDIDNTLILVGKNNTGKSSILSSIRAMSQDYPLSTFDYNQPNKSIQIEIALKLDEDDLHGLFQQGKISSYRSYEKWLEDFMQKLPSFKNNSILIGCKIYPDTSRRYYSDLEKNNPYLSELIPNLYVIDDKRNFDLLNDAFLDFQNFRDFDELKQNKCIFDISRPCNECFDCIPVINKKTPEQLSLFESALLLKNKLYSSNTQKYEDDINKYFQSNYSSQYQIQYTFDMDLSSLLNVTTYAKNLNNFNIIPVKEASTSMRNLYILSLFQAYLEVESRMGSIIIIDQPELHLHPELQKNTSNILYRLSQKNQVFFSTHSPIMLFQFSARHIKQVVLDNTHHTQIRENTNLDVILDDLGYNANDLMNVSFAFIVEGKDDKSRLPLLLEKYYSEIRDSKGNLNRISIIPTNSCTNIKTYANLKYINQTYLKDNFLMIRDSDGKNPDELKRQLCSYYYKRMHDDDAKIPRITPKNVLILKYYSFENYFLNPKIMAALGIIKKEEDFYSILFNKYQQYLKDHRSVKVFYEKTGIKINSIEDIKSNIEQIKIYFRGHNLFDIFYGKYRTREAQNIVLKEYVNLAPRDEFKDILDAIDSFVYFEGKKNIE